MSETEREKLAAKLSDAWFCTGGYDYQGWHFESPDFRRRWLDVADVAIAALSEPAAEEPKMREALVLAKNVLFLLADEVDALGLGAYRVREKVAEALAARPVEPELRKDAE